ncbi:hypothetical protein C0995_007164 [Termitomyces sp. Mi166|nr:hypothetical protein C0995_007164 [Termitomyces sp. Mi166\
MYPQRHPSIDVLSSEDFFKVTEASEKYEVFTVMNICNMRMKQILVDHPAEVFNYGTKHGYPDISNLAAPLMMGIPLEEIVTKLSPHLVVPWI